MPIPLRPNEPLMPVRARREPMVPRPEPKVAQRAFALPFRIIRREPELATAPAARVSDNDGWPCLPLDRR